MSKRLNSALVEALRDPAVQKRVAEVGQDVVAPDHQTPQALAAHHKAEIEKWTSMIKAVSIKTD